MGYGKLEKSWNLLFQFPGLEIYFKGRSWKVMEKQYAVRK